MRQAGVPGLQTADAYAQLKMHGSPSSHSGLGKAGQAEAWTSRSCKDFRVHQGALPCHLCAPHNLVGHA